MTESPITRPSTAIRWVPCPVAAWLEQQYPDAEGDAAREGTAAHEMGECVLTGIVSTAGELVNRIATNGTVFVPEMVPAVELRSKNPCCCRD